MNSLFNLALSALLAWTVLSAFPSPVLAAGDQCTTMSGPAVYAAIRAGEIDTWAHVKRRAGYAAYTDVSDATVCTVNGVPYYRVSLRAPSGDAKTLILPAARGGN